MPHATTNFSSQLEPMGIIFGAIRGFRNLNGSVNESYTSKRPQVSRHALNHLFRKRLDPWNYNLLLVRSQVLSDLEKPKIECIESSVVSRQFSVSARSQQNFCRHPRPVTYFAIGRVDLFPPFLHGHRYIFLGTKTVARTSECPCERHVVY